MNLGLYKKKIKKIITNKYFKIYLYCVFLACFAIFVILRTPFYSNIEQFLNYKAILSNLNKEETILHQDKDKLVKQSKDLDKKIGENNKKVNDQLAQIANLSAGKPPFFSFDENVDEVNRNQLKEILYMSFPEIVKIMGEPYSYNTFNIKYDESIDYAGYCGSTGAWFESPYISINNAKLYINSYIVLKSPNDNLVIIHETIHAFWGSFVNAGMPTSYVEGVAVAGTRVVNSKLSILYPNNIPDSEILNIQAEKPLFMSDEEFSKIKEQTGQQDSAQLGNNPIPLSYDKFHGDKSMESAYYALSGNTFYKLYKANNNILKLFSSKIYNKINSLSLIQVESAFSIEELKNFLRQDLPDKIEEQNRDNWLNNQKALNPQD